jgi:hypothetical protein
MEFALQSGSPCLLGLGHTEGWISPRHSVEPSLSTVREVDVALSQTQGVPQVCRARGITEQPVRWRASEGGSHWIPRNGGTIKSGMNGTIRLAEEGVPP